MVAEESIETMGQPWHQPIRRLVSPRLFKFLLVSYVILLAMAILTLIGSPDVSHALRVLIWMSLIVAFSYGWRNVRHLEESDFVKTHFLVGAYVPPGSGGANHRVIALSAVAILAGVASFCVAFLLIGVLALTETNYIPSAIAVAMGLFMLGALVLGARWGVSTLTVGKDAVAIYNKRADTTIMWRKEDVESAQLGRRVLDLRVRNAPKGFFGRSRSLVLGDVADLRSTLEVHWGVVQAHT